MIFIISLVGLQACTKTSFITSKDAQLNLSTDTLHFDTLFTTTGSVANRFKIFNPNNQKLRINSVTLAGGATSFFKMNVDGTAGPTFSNLDIEAGDSAYVFVTVTINPTAANLPFVVQDSVIIKYNGNERMVQLEAFGQNARFLRNLRITQNTTWTNNLPYVILGGISVDPGVTLNINEGSKIYAHADAPIIINGTLRVNGNRFDSTLVTFSGDRLDEGYRDFPGSWPGIFFSQTSRDNVLQYAVIKNAYQGIIALQGGTANNPKIVLNQCIIDNIFDVGILAVNSSIVAQNCLVTNCGFNIALTGGGSYQFIHCTVTSYSNLFTKHKNPVLSVNNSESQTVTNPLNAAFTNCIFYGDSGIVKNEIITDRKGTGPFSLQFTNVLYRNSQTIGNALFTNSINNVAPGFKEINSGKRIYNFRLDALSACINAGINAGILTDYDGKKRGGTAGLPDLGAFEF